MIAFDNICINGNMNEYSIKQVQTAYYVSILSGKTKNGTKTADRLYCSAFCSTDCSKLSQKVVQLSFLSLLTDRKYFTFS